ncbi:hypothetical protein Pan44_31600 [Caulifigura coniformis]|uniref:Uncharacterized protein n=1 Tax=Caulifigura coniformis TaxID=2527983 RepID=A0A517SG67_9PLAN|nr:hypothetical protein Pan44_31600 [Caulifigura coniformis]
MCRAAVSGRGFGRGGQLTRRRFLSHFATTGRSRTLDIIASIVKVPLLDVVNFLNS